MLAICSSCGGWYFAGSPTPMNVGGAKNIGMDYDKQCPCTCAVCKLAARACTCKGGASYALVTHGLGGRPWRPGVVR